MRKVQETHHGMESNGIYQRLVCVAMLGTSREVGLRVSTDTTKHVAMSRHQSTGKNHNLLIANKSFQNLSKIKYLERTVINQNCIHQEIKNRLYSKNACYHSVQNILSSRFLCKSLKIKIHKL
jgi:hypothetical protein